MDTRKLAQAFTTGPDPRGYLLLGVRLALLLSGERASATWAVYADDAGKPAAAPLAAALPLPSIDNGSDTFEELINTGGLRLEPATKYWIVISQPSSPEEGSISFAAWSRFNGFFRELDRAGQLEIDPEQSTEGSFALPSPDTPGRTTLYFVKSSPADAGSEDGWSLDLVALAWFWDNPDRARDDDPLIPALLPWSLLAYDALGLLQSWCCRCRCWSPRTSRCSSARRTTTPPRARPSASSWS